MRRLILALLPLVLGLPAFPGLAEGAQKVRLTVPVISFSMTPVYVAKAKGLFAEEGLEVEVTSTGGGGPDVVALMAGEADFTFTSGDLVMLAYQGGKRLRVVMTGLNRSIINWVIHKDVAKARGITEGTPLADKLKALKGLTVGVTQPGSLTSHLANFVVRQAGYVPHQDVKIIPVSAGPTWVAALENRKVDVALMSAPLPETAISRGLAIMFINNTKGEDPSIPEFLMEVLVTRPEVAEKNPELVRKMVRALVRANQWALRSTPEEMVVALQPSLSTTDRALLLAGVGSTVPALSPDGQTTERNVQTTQDILQRAGLLKSRIAFADLFTNEFLPR